MVKIDSPKHRKWIAQQPCLVTHYQGEYGVSHHLLRVEGKGMAIKTCDMWCVPLHSTIHDALHKNGNEIGFFANHGFDYWIVKNLALRFAALSPDPKIRKAAKEYLEKENAS